MKFWQWRHGRVVTLGLLLILGGGIWLAAASPASLTVKTKNFRFTRPEIRVPAGEMVTMTLDNCGILGHRGGGMIGTLIVE